MDNQKEPVTHDNMAMEFYSTASKNYRTLALPPGLTFAEAVAYAKKYQGKFEMMTGVVEYKS